MNNRRVAGANDFPAFRIHYVPTKSIGNFYDGNFTDRGKSGELHISLFDPAEFTGRQIEDKGQSGDRDADDGDGIETAVFFDGSFRFRGLIRRRRIFGFFFPGRFGGLIRFRRLGRGGFVLVRFPERVERVVGETGHGGAFLHRYAARGKGIPPEESGSFVRGEVRQSGIGSPRGDLEGLDPHAEIVPAEVMSIYVG